VDGVFAGEGVGGRGGFRGLKACILKAENKLELRE
jgi:hypothetical protein